MATIDINQYIEQSGMRKARFGGYEPDDVRQAMLDLCSDYEQRLNTAAQQVRGAQQEAPPSHRTPQHSAPPLPDAHWPEPEFGHAECLAGGQGRPHCPDAERYGDALLQSAGAQPLVD